MNLTDAQDSQFMPEESCTAGGAAISIIVPVYNAEKTLESCINSILSLDFPASQLQIILVNNNSEDRSAEILAKYSNETLTLDETRQGAAAARNKGIANANYDLIAFTDADCKVDPQWLSRLLEPLQIDREIGAVGGRIIAAEPANAIQRYGEVIHNHEAAINFFQPPYLMTSNMAIRKGWLDRVGLFDIDFLRGQDTELSRRLYYAGCRFAYAPGAVVSHHNQKTLTGLMNEGYLHGMWSVKVGKKHRASSRAGRIDYEGYLHIAESLFKFLRITSARRKLAIDPLCDFLFSIGKKFGKIMGSLRFRYLSV